MGAKNRLFLDGRSAPALLKLQVAEMKLEFEAGSVNEPDHNQTDSDGCFSGCA